MRLRNMKVPSKLGPDHWAQIEEIVKHYENEHISPYKMIKFLGFLNTIYETFNEKFDEIEKMRSSITVDERNERLEMLLSFIAVSFTEEFQINKRIVNAALSAPSTDL